MSGRRPLKEGARSVPLLVHSRNSTCATSRGSTKIVPFGGCRPLKGLRVGAQRLELALQQRERLFGEASADLPGVDEALVLHHSHRERAETRRSPTLARSPAADHHVLGVDVLHLDPVRRAHAWLVRAVELLGHHALDAVLAWWPRAARSPRRGGTTARATPAPPVRAARAGCAAPRTPGPSWSGRRGRAGRRSRRWRGCRACAAAPLSRRRGACAPEGARSSGVPRRRRPRSRRRAPPAARPATRASARTSG